MSLEERWFDILAEFGVDNALAKTYFEELLSHYTEVKRYYHNLQHIEHLFIQYDACATQIVDKAAVAMAIFYHDAIYSPVRSSQNEMKSAYLAVERLSSLGLPSPLIQQVFGLIEGTKHHQLAEEINNHSGQLFLDFDLAVLGLDRVEYERYTKKIRKEFGLFPDFVYRVGRRKALQYFLDLPTIYKTDFYQEHYEQKARENLLYEMDALT